MQEKGKTCINWERKGENIIIIILQRDLFCEDIHTCIPEKHVSVSLTKNSMLLKYYMRVKVKPGSDLSHFGSVRKLVFDSILLCEVLRIFL